MLKLNFIELFGHVCFKSLFVFQRIFRLKPSGVGHRIVSHIVEREKDIIFINFRIDNPCHGFQQGRFRQ